MNLDTLREPELSRVKRVLRYPAIQCWLRGTGTYACALMPGWPGWDRPHFLNKPFGNIMPLTAGALIRSCWHWRKNRHWQPGEPIKS
jgi:hypothetical protein